MVKKQTSRPFAAAKANGPGRPIAQVGPRVVSQARYTCPPPDFCFSLRTTPQTVEFYFYPTVSTALVHSVKPKLTE